MKIRNIIFTIIFCAFLLGPAGIFLSDKMGIDLPTWMTAENAKYLEGGVSEAQVKKNLSLEGFETEQLQTALESKVGNNIPFKAAALLGNAALQRGAIETSNCVFNWRGYPTYYGSEVLYDTELKALCSKPLSYSKDTKDDWEKFAQGVLSTAEEFSNKRFVIYVVQGDQTAPLNFAYDLMSDPIMPNDCVSTMTKIIEDHSNVYIVTKTYTSGDDYYRDFYKTDHHWDINGAYVAYEQLTQELDLDKTEMSTLVQIEDCNFNGSFSRRALMRLNEKVFDCDDAFGSLLAHYSDGSTHPCNSHEKFWDSSLSLRDAQFYDLYYDDLGNCKISGGSGERSALLISNSYRGAIQRFLATSYNELMVNDQLGLHSKVTTTFKEQIIEADADDIILLACPMRFEVSSEYWE